MARNFDRFRQSRWKRKQKHERAKTRLKRVCRNSYTESTAPKTHLKRVCRNAKLLHRGEADSEKFRQISTEQARKSVKRTLYNNIINAHFIPWGGWQRTALGEGGQLQIAGRFY